MLIIRTHVASVVRTTFQRRIATHQKVRTAASTTLRALQPRIVAPPPLKKNAYEGSRCGLFGGESGVIEDDLGEDPAFDAFESPYPWRQGREPAAECG